MFPSKPIKSGLVTGVNGKIWGSKVILPRELAVFPKKWLEVGRQALPFEMVPFQRTLFIFGENMIFFFLAMVSSVETLKLSVGRLLQQKKSVGHFWTKRKNMEEVIYRKGERERETNEW